MTKIDLHIHTNCSDGFLTPKEVIDEAINNNVNIISITDHDTIDAYTNDLINYAKDNNIELIKGVEISTKINKCGIHVLGYNYDANNIELINKLNSLKNARHNYLYGVSEKLKELGYIVNTDELDKIEAVTKAHIALDVIGNEDNKELLIKTFNHIPSKGEFIETIMNENCPAYVKKETITPKEAAELIHKANGKVVLAHPMAYTYEDNLSDEEIIDLIKDMQADGIEANYIYVDKDNNVIDDSNKWNDIASRLNLFTTIGSDFHNKDGIHPTIGSIDKTIDINILENN